MQEKLIAFNEYDFRQNPRDLFSIHFYITRILLWLNR